MEGDLKQRVGTGMLERRGAYLGKLRMTVRIAGLQSPGIGPRSR